MERDVIQAAFAAVAAEREQLCRQVIVLDERSRLLHDLLATFDAPSAPVVAAKAAPAKTAPKIPTSVKKTRRQRQVSCPDCGFVSNGAGIGAHRKAKHPGSAAKPVEPTPKPDPDIDPRRVLALAPEVADTRPSTRTVYRCGELDCGDEVATLVDLANHATVEHGRRPSAAERILVTPDTARAAS